MQSTNHSILNWICDSHSFFISLLLGSDNYLLIWMYILIALIYANLSTLWVECFRVFSKFAFTNWASTMLLRPNARTEGHRNRYKVVDADEGRRRRDDNMVVSWKKHYDALNVINGLPLLLLSHPAESTISFSSQLLNLYNWLD